MKHEGRIGMRPSKKFIRNLMEKNICQQEDGGLSKEEFLDLLENCRSNAEVEFVGNLGLWMIFICGRVYIGDPIKERIAIETMWIEPLYNKK